MPTIGNRLRHAWNAFTNKDPTNNVDYGYGGDSYRPDRIKFSRGNEKSIVTAIYNRIAVDISSMDIKHIRLDENGRFSDEIDSGLNECLTVEANKDQSSRTFIQDLVMSMFDEGYVAVVPTLTNYNPNVSSFDIFELRIAKIIKWYPDYVRVEIYNGETGKKEEMMCKKSYTAIVENPFFSIMNEPNSVLQRLVRKLNLLDVIDEQKGSGKLDLIIQLPYVIKTEARKQQAENRRKDIEMQLSSSKYGIAYTDGTEHITQLNRSVENNLLTQIEYLTNMLYSQLGITSGILDGSADEQTQLNYQNKILEPISSVITNEFIRKFLTKTARTQRQSIKFFMDPFKITPVSQISEIADKFTRNEILTSNEVRQIIGLKPSSDPGADELRNKNLNQSDAQTMETSEVDYSNMSKEEIVNKYKELTSIDDKLNEMDSILGGE